MTLTSGTKFLGARCNEFLRDALPPDAPVKHLSEILGQSRQTAARLYLGDAPTSAQLMALAAHFGKNFLVHIFEPVVGDMSEIATNATLARIEAMLGSLRASGRVDAPYTSAELARPHDKPATSTRLPLGEITRYPFLQAQLERYRDRFGQLEPGEALALARADSFGRSNVNLRKPRDVFRFAYRGRTSRLKSAGERYEGEPMGSFPDRAYAALSVRCSEEAEASSEPILARLSGAVLRADGRVYWTEATVLRTIDRSRDGTVVLSSHFLSAITADTTGER